MKRLLLKIGALLCLLLPSCKTIYVPVGTDTSTNVKDSTVLHIVDSVRYTERSRYKEYGALLDTVKAFGARSQSTAWIDTTLNVLNNELVEEPIEEKYKIITKTEYRDSIQTVERQVPYPVEVVKERRVCPRWLVVLSILGVISTLVLGFIGYLKIKR